MIGNIKIRSKNFTGVQFTGSNTEEIHNFVGNHLCKDIFFGPFVRAILVKQPEESLLIELSNYIIRDDFGNYFVLDTHDFLKLFEGEITE